MRMNQFKEIKKIRSSTIICPTDGAQKAYIVSKIYKSDKRSIVVIVKNQRKADELIRELHFFLPDNKESILLFPGYHILPFKSLAYHKETSVNRLASLAFMLDSGSAPYIMVTIVDTLMQKLIPKESIDDFTQPVMKSEEIDRDDFVSGLESGGYTKTFLVESPGEYALRGGIIDVFSPGQKQPFRIELFGDLVESIRYFSPYTQRGAEEIFETEVLPATEAIVTNSALPRILARLRKAGTIAGLDPSKVREYVNIVREFGRFPGIESMLSIIYERLDTFFDYVQDNPFFILDDPDDLESSAMEFENKARLNYENTSAENRLCVEPENIYLDWKTAKQMMNDRPHIRIRPFEEAKASFDRMNDHLIAFDYQANDQLAMSLKREGTKENPLRPLVDWIETHVQHQKTICFILSQASQAQRLIALLKPYGIELQFKKSFTEIQRFKKGVYYLYGDLSSGFVVNEDNICFVTEKELFGQKRIIRRQRSDKRDLKTEFIPPEELKNGDIVVHAEHGVGQYDGLYSLNIRGIAQDFILILYRDNDKLYLPVDRIEMIGKYIGVDGYTPGLDKIGSKRWVKSKAKAKEEVEKLAADLLNLYAARKVNTGFAFSRPDNYYRDFEASFVYEETRDQLSAIDDVHLDMESGIPMDRLVCGDVGYGKTEVAIRAAFKAVNDGQQVAVVVPTTILAEQHLNTFRDRFNNYPVNIECLSRFRTKKKQKSILKRIRSGIVDIAIGTHRLLQKDVDFHSLGLLIIDEEQRFGVKHKERLKKKRHSVDVLALTATPIPRTLHMSLTGIRDISIINTPPADRQPILSYISTYEDAIVRDAIQRELSRKGQIFFVHNNIKTINKVTQKLEKLIPDARFGVAHGRLPENELETVMLRFINFEIDVLVCTTIIESGLDIPSANTMIVNKIERFGLSQIYQLRGRIGRGDYQAYAYLFISDERRLTKDAKKRLSALMEHKDLGSGFQIAMKDLQIRGAGTALGASQSGHIAAVGYDMFLKLLDQAVKDLKGEETLEKLEPEINTSMSSGFPVEYIESVGQRLTLYRRLSRLTRLSDITDIKEELADRYGKLPKPAENMLLKIMLRVLCIKAGVQRLDLTPDTLTLSFSPMHRKKDLNALQPVLKKVIGFNCINKNTIKMKLGHKRNRISKALLETRNLLKAII